MMETILLHMMILLDDPKLGLDGILHDDANLDPNTHDDVTHDATLLLNILLDDPTLQMRCSQDTPGEVVQRLLYTI